MRKEIHSNHVTVLDRSADRYTMQSRQKRNGGTHMRHNFSTHTPWEAMAGYSRAVRIGNIIAVSGTTASNAAGEVQHIGDAGAQATYIIRKIESSLAEAGASLSDVIRTRIFVANIADWEAVARAHGAIFGNIRPANTLVSASMVDPLQLVEIEADAVISND